MVFGKAKEALGDMAQTIRRLFGEPRVGSLTASRFQAQGHGELMLGARVIHGLPATVASVVPVALFEGEVAAGELPSLEAVLREEHGWDAWASGARAVETILFEAGKTAQLAVPPLPKVTRVQAPREPLPRPGIRSLEPKVAAPGCRSLDVDRGLETRTRSEVGRALLQPFAFPGEDLAKLPKNLWMRYSLALVKATGENVRNLEVVGLYRLPRKGVSDLRPDGQGRIWVRLTPEAVGAKRAPFMLARRKDDQAFVSACVDES
ncbi:MAG TPA: hypothetical protein VJ623_15865 [Holophagaceae bacterium]|nr:hypothetical protein [Holophagaceae bacterium]